MGDFSVMTDLPAMYKHCKATEDVDMTPFDFVTDHLINIDCLFDKHDNGDKQKPHTPIPFHHQQAQNYFFTQLFNISENDISVIEEIPAVVTENMYHSNYLSFVFRPPIV
jgi:hypothetical protein